MEKNLASEEIFPLPSEKTLIPVDTKTELFLRDTAEPERHIIMENCENKFGTNPSISPNPFLYKRGFLLSRELLLEREGWISRKIGTAADSWNICFDGINETFYKEDGEDWIFLLGIVSDLRNGTLSKEAAAGEMIRLLRISRTGFLDYIDWLGGRFLLIYHSGGVSRLMTDCCGMRSCFFDREKKIAASHYNLVQDFAKESDLPYFAAFYETYRKNRTPWCLPANLTPFQGIVSLIPNHELDLSDFSQTRFFPRENLKTENPETIFDEVAGLLRSQVRLITEKYPVAMSLTNGNNSRISLAAAREFKDKIQFFTYHYKDLPQEKQSAEYQGVCQDYAYAAYAAKTFHLPYRDFVVDQSDPALLTVRNRNHYHSHARAATDWYCKTFPSDSVHLRSNLAEILRTDAFRRSSAAIEENFARWAGYRDADNTPEVRNFFLRYYKDGAFDQIRNYPLTQIFSWEYQMSVWVGNACVTESDLAMDTYQLFNCRAILMKCLAFNKFFRDSNMLVLEIIRRLWPELLFSIPNTTTTLLDFCDPFRIGHIPLSKMKFNNPEGVPAFYLPRNSGCLFGFASPEIRKDSFLELSGTLPAHPKCSYLLQVNLSVPQQPEPAYGKTYYEIFLDGKSVYTFDTTNFFNAVNSVCISFQPGKDRVEFAIRLSARFDFTGIHCGIVNLESVYFKQAYGKSFNPEPEVVSLKNVLMPKPQKKKTDLQDAALTASREQLRDIEKTSSLLKDALENAMTELKAEREKNKLLMESREYRLGTGILHPAASFRRMAADSQNRTIPGISPEGTEELPPEPDPRDR